MKYCVILKNPVNIKKKNNGKISKIEHEIRARKYILKIYFENNVQFFQFFQEFNFNSIKVNVSDLRLHPHPRAELVLGRVNCAVALECRFVVSYAPLQLRGACKRRHARVYVSLCVYVCVCAASHSLPRRDPIATCYTLYCVSRLSRAPLIVSCTCVFQVQTNRPHINMHCNRHEKS